MPDSLRHSGLGAPGNALERDRTDRTHQSGYAFVEAAGGGRIYWNNLYSGFAVFEKSLRLHRPDLFGNQAARRPSGTTTRENIGSRNETPSRPLIEPHVAPLGTSDIPPGSGGSDT